MGISSFKFFPSGLYNLYYQALVCQSVDLKVISLFSSNELNLLFLFSLVFISCLLPPHKAKGEQRVNNNENLHLTLIATLDFEGHTG